jgi:hypothetical protein
VRAFVVVAKSKTSKRPKKHKKNIDTRRMKNLSMMIFHPPLN